MADIQETEGLKRIMERLKEAESMMRAVGTYRGSISDRDRPHAEKWIAFAEVTHNLRKAITEHAFAKIGLSIPEHIS